MDNLIKQLKTNIFSRATIFIEQIGEFAPFGAKALPNEIKDSVVYDDKDVLDGSLGVKMLEKDILNDFDANKIIGAAIAFDVSASFQNADGVSEKRDALCLRITTDGKEWSEEYFPYMLIDGQCVWR